MQTHEKNGSKPILWLCHWHNVKVDADADVNATRKQSFRPHSHRLTVLLLSLPLGKLVWDPFTSGISDGITWFN